MADFIAVIRRAVDGLSDNTPEMRAKVYERARAAVVRQLENMKPRPPEAMFQRQLDKLDAAVHQVEEEHAEALPADDLPAVAPAIANQVLVDDQALGAPEPAVAEIPAEPEPRLVEQPVRQDSIDDFLEPIPEPAPLPPAVVFEPAPAWSADAPATPPAPVVAPAVEAAFVPRQDPVPAAAVADLDDPTPLPDEYPMAAAPVVEDLHQDAVYPGEPLHAASVSEPAQTARPPQPAPNWSVDIDEEPEVAAVVEETVVPMPKVSYDEDDVVSGFNEFVQREMNRTVVPPPPRKAAKEDFSWDAPFDDLPEIQKPEAFEQALEAKQKELADQAALRGPEATQPTAREELADLIGFDREAATRPRSSSASATSDLPPDVTRAVSKLEGKSFRMQKKKKKSRVNPMLIGLGIAGALALCGGAYAAWTFRTDISSAFASLMPATEAEKPLDTPVAETKTVKQAEPVEAVETGKTEAEAKATEVASLETVSGAQKFTQRLMPDGSEADTGKSKLPVDQALTEGKTVFGQTEPGKDVAAANSDTATDANDTAQPAALGVTQKMFLYEERLGQSSPVAVPGTIVWSEKADTSDGKPNPTIEAQINIPERKITALMTFKRNIDASLPASHIIEIVFAIPKDFPEGNVESVQRVAFKQTEQDRGDPLVAVPAKITDDFHMVALNDDAEARKANLDLMKRSWIDIPITYRNGRRALITLEKGASGTAVFDKVLGEWAALGNQTAN